MNDPETEGYEDFDAEELVEEVSTPEPIKPKPRGRPVKPKPVQKTEPVVNEAKYVAYHQPESIGIVDRETNEVIGTDVYPILAEILNKLENIEKTTG